MSDPSARPEDPADIAAEPSSPRKRILWASTWAFTILFAVWLMLGVLGLESRRTCRSCSAPRPPPG